MNTTKLLTKLCSLTEKFNDQISAINTTSYSLQNIHTQYIDSTTFYKQSNNKSHQDEMFSRMIKKLRDKESSLMLVLRSKIQLLSNYTSQYLPSFHKELLYALHAHLASSPSQKFNCLLLSLIELNELYHLIFKNTLKTPLKLQNLYIRMSEGLADINDFILAASSFPPVVPPVWQERIALHYHDVNKTEK